MDKKDYEKDIDPKLLESLQSSTKSLYTFLEFHAASNQYLSKILLAVK
jgi:hypothetical protein